MCDDAARRPAALRPLLTTITGLEAVSLAADLAEALRVPERLEVQEHGVGAVVLLPEAQEVVARQVGLVAHRDERRQPKARYASAWSSAAMP